MVLRVAGEMKDRKGYFGGDQGELIATHKELPESLKLKMLVCVYDNEPIAALGWPIIGSIGLPLVGGTGNKALKLNASYLLWWKMIEYYKAHGFRGLDAGGVSEERNPGGYLFKTGLLGKDFDCPNQFIGQFDAWGSRLSQVLFKTVYLMRDSYRDMRRGLANRMKGANRA